MNILLIGAYGFIGTQLSCYLKAKGHRVIGCVSENSKNQNDIVINRTKLDFSEIFKLSKFDVCINAAGSSSISFSYEHTEDDYQRNVVLVDHLLKAIVHYSPQTKFINFSSMAVCGDNQELYSDPSPISPYGKHKLEAERICEAVRSIHHVKTLNLRICSVYGPGLRKQIFWDVYRKSLENSKVLELNGTGEEQRDFIYIENLCEIISTIIDEDRFGKSIISVGNGIPLTIKSVLNLYFEILDIKKEILFNGITRRGDPFIMKAIMDDLNEMNYTPSYTLEGGLREYAKWLRKI